MFGSHRCDEASTDEGPHCPAHREERFVHSVQRFQPDATGPSSIDDQRFAGGVAGRIETCSDDRQDQDPGEIETDKPADHGKGKHGHGRRNVRQHADRLSADAIDGDTDSRDDDDGWNGGEGGDEPSCRCRFCLLEHQPRDDDHYRAVSHSGHKVGRLKENHGRPAVVHAG